MNVQRVREEVADLNDSWPVKWSANDQYVMVTQFRYPEGWSPRTAPLFFSLPDDYPVSPPDVYLPPDSRYEGETIFRMYGPNDDGWWKWCIIQLGWNPEDFDLRTLSELMRTSLADPDDATPVQTKARKNGGDTGGILDALFGD